MTCPGTPHRGHTKDAEPCSLEQAPLGWIWTYERGDGAYRPRRPDDPPRDGAPPTLDPHVCDYVEPDGTTAGGCHLLPPHGGRCPACSLAAADCAHQPRWETLLLCPDLACAVHR